MNGIVRLNGLREWEALVKTCERSKKMREVSFSLYYEVTLPDEYDDMDESSLIENIQENWSEILDDNSFSCLFGDVLEIL